MVLPYFIEYTHCFALLFFILHRHHSSVLWECHFIVTPSCSNTTVGGANTPINILLPAQDIHRPICGRVVLFYLCSGTAPTFSVVEIDIGTCDCIVDLAAVLHDTAILIASYSLVTLVLVALGPFWWREIPRAELTAR